MKNDYDLIIAGAGIAGSGSALALAPDGYRILLLDREIFPRHKPCGEGLMPQGADILEKFGVLPELLNQGAVPIHGLKFHSRAGIVAAAGFPPHPDGRPAHGIVMRRYELDNLLLQRAATVPNVTLRQGFHVTEALEENGVIRGIRGHSADGPLEEIRAPLTLGTDGPLSVFHKVTGIVKLPASRKRYGLSGHLRGVTRTTDQIEIYHQNGYELYLAPANAGLTLVAVLLEEAAIKSHPGKLIDHYLDFLRETPGFAPRIIDAELIPPVGARGPLAFTVTPVYRPGLLLLGDSAGFLDPITGEGMTLALKCVMAAQPIIRAAFERDDFSESQLAPYAAAREALIQDIWQLTSMMLELNHFEWIADRAIQHLSHDPALFQKLLGIVTGTQRYHDFTLKDRLALGLG